MYSNNGQHPPIAYPAVGGHKQNNPIFNQQPNHEM